MRLKTVAVCVLAVLSVAAPIPSAHAGEKEELQSLRETTLNLLKLLVEQGVITQQKADELMAKAARPADSPSNSGAATGEDKVVRVQYVSESVKKAMREEIKQEVLAQAKTERWGEPGALPDWLSRISWEGDVRVRYQHDAFPKEGEENITPAEAAAQGISIRNTAEERDRLRVRARLGMKAKISDSVAAGIRVTTGASGVGADPVSTNQTMGTYGARYTIGLDRAFLSYNPWRGLHFIGGRMGNPFYAGTDLVWSENLSFDGVALRYLPPADRSGVFGTIGAFPIQDVEPTPQGEAESKWMYGYQGGVNWQFAKRSSAKFGLAYYDYRNVEGRPNTSIGSTAYNETTPAFRQKGNSVFDIRYDQTTPDYLWGLSSKFQELNLSSSLDIGSFDPVHMLLDLDYVKNLGYDAEEIRRRTGETPAEVDKTEGYQFRLTVGMPVMRSRGDWAAFVGYRHLERDAVLDAFTDSDFRLGGTNARGYFVGGRYAFEKNTFMSLRWMSSQEIDGPPLAIDTLQLDLNTAF